MLQNRQQEQTNSIISRECKDGRRQIACKVWFPVGKDPFPISFKFKDDNDEIQMVNNISIYNIDVRCTAGFQTNVYNCKAVICGLMRNFRIIYYLKTYEWFVLF